MWLGIGLWIWWQSMNIDTMSSTLLYDQSNHSDLHELPMETESPGKDDRLWNNYRRPCCTWLLVHNS